MPGPLHAPTVLFMYAFRHKDELTGRWIKARYRAEQSVIAESYREWQIIGEPEVRRHGAAMFSPWR